MAEGIGYGGGSAIIFLILILLLLGTPGFYDKK
jgi:hypothetical protein